MTRPLLHCIKCSNLSHLSCVKKIFYTHDNFFDPSIVLIDYTGLNVPLPQLCMFML